MACRRLVRSSLRAVVPEDLPGDGAFARRPGLAMMVSRGVSLGCQSGSPACRTLGRVSSHQERHIQQGGCMHLHMPLLLDLSAPAFALIVEALQFMLSPAGGDVHIFAE